jgi:hypothetical protein
VAERVCDSYRYQSHSLVVVRRPLVERPRVSRHRRCGWSRTTHRIREKRASSAAPARVAGWFNRGVHEMRKLILFSAGLLSIACASGGVSAKAVAAASPDSRNSAACGAKYYDYLVGKSVDELRDIRDSTNYRVVQAGTPRGAPQPKRMTVTIDKRNMILEVACG